MFDKVEIKVKAGHGGNGVIRFRREKSVPFGGPSGGDGGKGGNVIIRADSETSDLREYVLRREYKADYGGHGDRQQKHGSHGEDLILRVPVGTLVFDKTGEDEQVQLADLETHGQEIMVAKGGRGGWGNIHFATPTNQVPRISQNGDPGEEKAIVLEMRIIADVGIIGYPNVGKSTLLAAASAANPKIGNYPFTTTEPVLGVVETGGKKFSLAEIPGLIEGAHMGKGLGHDFLRHSMRTKVFIHLIDGSSVSPAEDMVQVNTELSLFDKSLGRKPQIVAINKFDLPEVRERAAEFKEIFRTFSLKPYFISAATGEGVDALMAEAERLVEDVPVLHQEATDKDAVKVFRPRPRRKVSVHLEDNVFVIESPELERYVRRMDINNTQVVQLVQGHMARIGVNKELEKAGAKPGARLRCGEAEWNWGWA
jgi:GTP-binding protein